MSFSLQLEAENWSLTDESVELVLAPEKQKRPITVYCMFLKSFRPHYGQSRLKMVVRDQPFACDVVWHA